MRADQPERYELPKAPRLPLDLLKRKRWVAAERWYRVGNFVAFWDASVRSWCVHLIDADGNQVTSTEYFATRAAYEMAADVEFFRRFYMQRG